MDTQVFRSVSAAELPSVWALWRACVRDGRCLWNDDYPNRDFLQTDWENGWLRALFQGGLLVGSVSLMPTDDLEKLGFPFQQTERVTVITRLCVHPALQGCGNGRALLEHAHRYIADGGFAAAHLLCDVRNTRALTLYHRAGYHDVCKAALYGERFTVMEKVFP